MEGLRMTIPPSPPPAIQSLYDDLDANLPKEYGLAWHLNDDYVLVQSPVRNHWGHRYLVAVYTNGLVTDQGWLAKECHIFSPKTYRSDAKALRKACPQAYKGFRTGVMDSIAKANKQGHIELIVQNPVLYDATVAAMALLSALHYLDPTNQGLRA